MVAAGCGGTGRELAPFAGPHGLAGSTSSPARSPSTPRPAARGRGSWRSPEVSSTPSACPTPGSSTSSPPSSRGWSAQARGSSSRSPARRWGSTPTWPAGSAARPASPASRSTSAPPTRPAAGLFEVREPFHAASVIAAVRREFPTDRPVLAKLRPDVSRIVEGARACHEAGATAVVDRQRGPGGLRRRAPGRPERSGGLPDRAALRRRGAPGAAGRPDHRRAAGCTTARPPAPSSTPARAPYRSAPPSCTTRRP